MKDEALDKALELALEALEAQHRDRLNYTLAKRSANATCAEFKVNTLSELIESGYMHGMGKQTESAITAIKQARAAPVQELPFGVGGGLVAIKTLLSRDPCVHANTAIQMIDAILTTPPTTPPTPVQEQKPYAYANPDDLSADTAFRWCKINEFTMPVYTTPPAAQPAPVPVKTFHGGKPWPLHPAPVQSAERGEPVAWMDADGDVYKSEPHPNWCPPHVPLCIIPSQRKPSHK